MRRAALLGTALALALLGCETSVGTHARNADRFYSQGRFADAAHAYESALASEQPMSPKLRLAIAVSLADIYWTFPEIGRLPLFGADGIVTHESVVTRVMRSAVARARGESRGSSRIR